MSIMKKLIYGVILMNLLTSLSFNAAAVDATSVTSGVVISGIITGTGASAKAEMIRITNQTSQAIDLQNWRLFYSSASGATTTTKFTFSHVLAAQSSFVLKTTEMTSGADAIMDNAGLSQEAGSIQLKNSEDVTIDTVGWAEETKTVAFSETSPARAPSPAQALIRYGGLDTDNNQADFILVNTSLLGQPDSDDICSDIEGLQNALNDELFTYHGDGTCTLLHQEAELASPYLTELLPDPEATADDEGEFIELYNPNTEAFSLEGYQLKVGTKTFTFSNSHIIPAQAYVAVYSLETRLTLSNNGSHVQLLAPETAEIINETSSYTQVDPDQSFALFADGWRLTDQPTPGQANVLLELSEEEIGGRGGVTSSVQADCPAGKYRSPETNRCRNYETAVRATLASCNEDEYRSPETHRCRKVKAATTPTPCQMGYERNLETNRCRKKTASIADLSPCKQGYERNPDTNRCRKMAAIKNIMTPAALEPNTVNIWLAGAGVTAVTGYAAWEWRREIWGGVKKIFPSSNP